MVYTDNAGNVLLGDAIYSQGTGKLTGYPFSNISTELTALLTQSNMKFRNVVSQTALNTNFINIQTLCFFSSESDSIDDRFTFAFSGVSQASAFSPNTQIVMFNNNGCTTTTNTDLRSGGVWTGIRSDALLNNTLGQAYQLTNNTTLMLNSNFVGVSDGESLALLHFTYNNNSLYHRFMYAGRLADVNPNYAYYNTSIETDAILMTNNASVGAVSNGVIGITHRIAGTGKQILSTGDAQYPIVCSDGQSPTAQWATDFYVFDNNATLGYPAIGRVRNLLLAQGTYTIGKPVKIQGTVQPDNGFNAWLPIGTFGDKVVLMRCYSSASL